MKARQTAGHALDLGLVRYKAASAIKRELIERFKPLNAVHSNSLRYVPIAFAELQAEPRTGPADELLEHQTGPLLEAVLHYSLTRDAALAEEVRERVITKPLRAPDLGDLLDALFPKHEEHSRTAA